MPNNESKTQLPEAKHTPLPWVVSGDNNNFRIIPDNPSVKAIVARIDTGLNGEIAANAAFIVLAANNHQVLVNALEKCNCDLICSCLTEDQHATMTCLACQIGWILSTIQRKSGITINHPDIHSKKSAP